MPLEEPREPQSPQDAQDEGYEVQQWDSPISKGAETPTQQPSPIESMIIDEGDGNDKGDSEQNKVRRSNRTFKRPRKYFEDEILEEEAFIFDGYAIDRMFKQSESSTAPINSVPEPPVADTIVEDTPPREPARPSVIQPKNATKQSKDKPEKSKSLKKTLKAMKMQFGEDDVPPPTAGRKCFYFDCNKADRSLRVLRPFLIPTCKTHSLRIEGRLLEAVASGKMRMHEGGGKDNICGACAGVYGPEIIHCGNDSCAFSFCDRCAKSFSAKYDNPYTGDDWSCWVCEAVKDKNRSKERTRYLLGLTTSINPSYQQTISRKYNNSNNSNFVNNNNNNNSHKEKYDTPKANSLAYPPPFTTNEEESTRGKNSRQVKQKSAKNNPTKEPEVKFDIPKVTTALAERNQTLDGFLDSLLTSMKYFTQQGDIAQSEEAVSEKLANLFDLAKQLKILRTYEDTHDNLWSQIKRLGILIKKYHLTRTNAQESEELSKDMTLQHMAILDALQQSIDASRVHYSFMEVVNEFKETYEQTTRELEVAESRAAAREELVTRQARTLEQEAAIAAVDANSWRAQEVELMEKLSAVRTGLSSSECKREGLIQRINDMKNELLVSQDMLRIIETNVHKASNKFENEHKSFHLISQLMEGFNWFQRSFVSKKAAEAENVSSTKSSGSSSLSVRSSHTTGKTKKNLGVFYHKACLGLVNSNGEDKLDGLIASIHEWQWTHSDSIDVFSNPPEVDSRYLMVVHDPLYIKKLRINAGLEPPLILKPPQVLYLVEEEARSPPPPEVFVNPLITANVLKAAYHAAGVVCEAVDSVTRGGYARAFCAVQPPGNTVGRSGRSLHANSDGIHVLNNVAIGAKYALLTAGYDRIAIFDYSIYQGCGTQDIVQGDDHFLYVSLHLNSNPPEVIYPHLVNSMDMDTNHTQNGMLEVDFSNICNIQADEKQPAQNYMTLFWEKVVPKIEEFKPQLILLSSGFEGHEDDPVSTMNLTDKDYFFMTKKLVELAQKYAHGRVVSVLEGDYGYEYASLKKCVLAHLNALVGAEEHERVNTSRFRFMDFKNQENDNSDSIPKKVSIGSLLQ